MKRLVLAALAAIFAAPAAAADLPIKAHPAPAAYVNYDPFSGAYLGVNIGYGWDFGKSAAAFEAVPLADLAALPQGFLGGIQAGYGFRPVPWGYLGIEGDVDGAALTGTSTMPGLITTTSKNSWLASLRADIGIIPVGHALIYGTVGYGWGGGEFTVNELFTEKSNVAASINPTMSGLVWGGGIKVPLGPNWIAGVKYLQYDFGSASLGSPTMPGLVYATDRRVDVVRAELNYKF
jgi:outer membrane immunogenic protein